MDRAVTLMNISDLTPLAQCLGHLNHGLLAQWLDGSDVTRKTFVVGEGGGCLDNADSTESSSFGFIFRRRLAVAAELHQDR